MLSASNAALLKCKANQSRDQELQGLLQVQNMNTAPEYYTQQLSYKQKSSSYQTLTSTSPGRDILQSDKKHQHTMDKQIPVFPGEQIT